MRDRRSFLRDSARAVAAAPLILSPAARGANDRPAFGVIGTGGRGRYLNRTFQKLGARCVAVCDVYEPNLESAQRESPTDVKTYVDYRRMLEQKGMDFVVIATPDHQHQPNLTAALDAKLDVYLEKPLSMSLEQSAEMVAAVRRTDRIVQVGMQRRSMPFIRKAKELVDQGALGKITMVKALWNWHFDLPLDNSPLPGKLHWDLFLGPAPKRPLEPRRFRWWRGFWDYSGGNMTDQGTHLMDVVQWFTNSGPPRSAVCQGAIINAPGAEVPNVFCATFEYPEFIATWTLNYRTAYDHDWSIQFQGEKATMVLDRFGYRIYRDPGGSPTPWAQKEKMELVAQEEDRDGPEVHLQNFLDCIRSRREPTCTVETAAAAVAGPHMANLAYLRGKKVTLSPKGEASFS
ncbi:MAG: Gfo/Idh/MocA family oxidoreductase [Bryobacteraceae bacterium]|nr:Gfo/Idh/MocA family oxidoreductase [Bryobacteraceae bacterium]